MLSLAFIVGAMRALVTVALLTRPAGHRIGATNSEYYRGCKLAERHPELTHVPIERRPKGSAAILFQVSRRRLSALDAEVVVNGSYIAI
jgi:hypothetical protein